MQQPGWYPDPDGTPQRLRWWDGQHWTQHVQQHAGHPAPMASDPRRKQSAAAIAVVSLAVLATLALIAWFGLRWFSPPQPSDAGPVSQLPRPSALTPAATPTVDLTPRFPTTRASEPVPEPTPWHPNPCSADASAPGTLTDGHLTVTLGPEWEVGEPSPWFQCGQAALMLTDFGDTTVTVGRSLLFAEGDDQEAAEEIFSMAQLELGTLTVQAKDSQAATLDGTPAWQIDALVGGDHGPAQRIVVVSTTAAGEQPSLLLATGYGDDPEGGAALRALLESVRVG